MSTRLFCSKINSHGRRRRSQPHFRVLILYENLVTGCQAKRLYQHLFQRLENCVMDSQYWKLSDLVHPEAWEGVAEAAQVADLIIVAAHDTAELSGEAQAALEAGLPERSGKAGALVAFLGRTGEECAAPSELHLYLQETARRNGLDFFPADFEMAAQNSVDPAAARQMSSLDVDQSQPPFWGQT